MPIFKVPVDLSLSELRNAVIQNLGTPPTGVEGRIYYDTSLHTFRVHNGSTWVSIGGVPTTLDFKQSVRAASTGNVSVGSAPATIDGVTLAADDRVLLKDQTDPSENGIRVFTAAGAALQRAADADTSDEVTTGMFTFVAEGTANGDKGYVLTTNDTITLGTTSLTFTQFSGAGTVTGTSNRITITGNQVDISSAYAGQATITIVGTVASGTWQATPIALAYGGTGATDAGGARTALGLGGAALLNVGTGAGTVAAGDDSRLTGVTHKYETTIGNGAATSFTVTHSLGTTGVTVEVYEVSSGATVGVDVVRTTTNAVTIGGFTTAPTTNQYAVVVIG